MSGKAIVPVLYSCGGGASYQSGGPYELDLKQTAGTYNHRGADGILILEESGEDAEHEAAISLCRELAREIEVPLYLGGRIRRFEDVKKYLYTGAAAVFVDEEDRTESQAGAEARERFGEEKVCFRAYRKQIHPIDELSTEAISWKESILFVSAFADTDFFEKKQRLAAMGLPVLLPEIVTPWEELKKGADGLVPCIVQDYRTNEVLMMAYMNEQAYVDTIRTGRMCYYSRSRQTQWLKGETSGHFQYVKALMLDCDQDTLLAKVAQIGVACHTGAYSCFFQTLLEKGAERHNPHKVLEEVYRIILDRKEHPKEGSYTNYLFDKGIDKILKKCGEEAAEIIIAAKNPDPEEIKYEISDFLYHVMVLMAVKGVTWEDIMRELANR